MPVRLWFYDPDGQERVVRDGRLCEGKFHPLQIGDHYARRRVFDRKGPRERRRSHEGQGALLE
ncbi:MAG TPA: hypothetical protein VJV22_18145 [Acidobacteriaceae bacterium]|nr:hypothetical protein [Acidobacteriaceae bacterium]